MKLLLLLKVLKNFNGDLYKINVDNSRSRYKVVWTEKRNANWGTEYLRFENNTIEWTNDESDFKVEMVFQNNYYISKETASNENYYILRVTYHDNKFLLFK